MQTSLSTSDERPSIYVLPLSMLTIGCGLAILENIRRDDCAEISDPYSKAIAYADIGIGLGALAYFYYKTNCVEESNNLSKCSIPYTPRTECPILETPFRCLGSDIKRPLYYDASTLVDLTKYPLKCPVMCTNKCPGMSTDKYPLKCPVMCTNKCPSIGTDKYPYKCPLFRC
jgi:hypothetical protein